MAEQPDHYATLAVDPAASPAEIKAAYRRRSRELHPDYNRRPGATREMAALNAAYAVLSEPAARERYDLARPGRYKRVTATPVQPPPVGRGSLQPDRRPDWYAFLGVQPWANSAEVLEASRRLGTEIREAPYEPDVLSRLRTQLRTATEWLATPALRDIYDGAMEGVPPPPGSHPHLHEHWYSFLGLRPSASLDRIAERVTELSAGMRKGSAEQLELNEAWRTLRDPARRAEYDAGVAAGARHTG
ncbi:MAG: DnaJ domain-containing protein [Candidatus Eisenbacteria bacterium]|uniref:DnaJ domain-containing protein n=1 Tax=Eiseniibacteriota bacterium TaxID=2212470 RepID=A0A956RRE7_UNCEI|nr:DnaJ domain-containing protein [Candidatus Eisenbacteria bacterium]